MSDETAHLSDDDITALRRAAAMAHTVGGITIQLRSAGRALATVLPISNAGEFLPHPAAAEWTDRRPGPVLDSCGFRIAVARAWCDHQAGQRVALVGQRVSDLDTSWSIRPPGRLLGFGGVRTHCGGRMIWAMPSLLSPDALTAVLGELDDLDRLHRLDDDHKRDAPTSLLETVEARLVRDDLLGVSVVHVEVGPEQLVGAPPRLTAMLDEVICRLVAASAAAELLESVATLA